MRRVIVALALLSAACERPEKKETPAQELERMAKQCAALGGRPVLERYYVDGGDHWYAKWCVPSDVDPSVVEALK